MSKLPRVFGDIFERQLGIKEKTKKGITLDGVNETMKPFIAAPLGLDIKGTESEKYEFNEEMPECEKEVIDAVYNQETRSAALKRKPKTARDERTREERAADLDAAFRNNGSTFEL